LSQGLKLVAVNAVYLVVARSFSSATRVVYAIALAVFLGPQLYGMFNLGMAWYLFFLPISMLGLDSILIREIGRRPQESKNIASHTLALRSVSTVAIAIVCFILGLLWESDHTARVLLVIFSFALLGRGLSFWVYAIFNAYQKSVHVFRLEAIFRTVEVIIGLALLLSGYGVLAVALTHAAVWFLQGFTGFYMVRTRIGKIRPIWDASAIRKLVIQGLPFVFSALLIAWMTQGGIFTVRVIDGYTKELGMLALAMQVLFIIGAILAELGTAALPALSRSVVRGHDDSRYFIDITLRGGLLIAGFLGISGLVLGPLFIDQIFGPDYYLVTTLIPWTLLWVAPYFIMLSLNNVIVALGAFTQSATIYFFGALVFTIVILPLHYNFGILGVLWALGAGMISVNAVQIYFLKKHFQINYSRSILRPLLVLIMCFSFYKHFIDLDRWALMALCTLLYLLIPLLLRVISKKEILEIYKTFRIR
jgi:O-antigen/teichoic acid export membrane protein